MRFGPGSLSSVVLFLVLAHAAPANAQGTVLPPDPIIGSWTLDVTRSKFVTPALKSMSIAITPAARGYTMTIDAVGADDQPQQWHFTSAFDGAETAISGNPQIDTVVASSTGNGATMRYKKAGVVITTTTSVASADGKTLVVTIKIPDGKGSEFTNIAVYQRQ